MKTKLLTAGLGLAVLALLAHVGGAFDPAPEPSVEATDLGDAGAPDAGGVGRLSGRAPNAAPPLRGPAKDESKGLLPVVTTSGPGRLVGHVISETTGKGIPAVRITCVVPAAGNLRADDLPARSELENVYWSDAEGAFVCDALPTGFAYRLIFQHADYAYADRTSLAFRPGQREIDVGAVLMGSPLSIEGRVVDADGAPIAGVAVTAGDPRIQPMPVGFDYTPDRLRGALAHSDASGRFTLRNLGAGYHRLVARKTGFATVAQGGVHVRPGRAPLTITMQPAERLEVVVVDPTGAPVEGALVDVRLDESVRAGRQGFTRQFTWARERTDPRGRVTVADLPRARELGVVLQVTHPAFTEFYESLSAQPPSPYRITLQPLAELTGQPVRVRLVGPDGEEIAGTAGYVQISGEGSAGYFERRAPIAADGPTTVEGIPSGEHYLYVLAPGYREGTRTIEVGRAPLDVELSLTRGAVARGTVLDALSGEPIAGATVRQNEVNAVETDTAGRFALHGLAGGRTLMGAMRVSAPGYLDASPAVPFPRGAMEVEMAIHLQPVSTLRVVEGVVRGPGGSPVAGALLALELSGVQPYTVQTQSGIDGRFAFEGLPPDHLPDPARIRILHAHHALADVQLARSALWEPLTIRLERGRRVRGRVLDETGAPVADASVGVISTDRWWTIEGERIGGSSMDSWTYRILPILAGSGATDAEGRFELPRLPSDALQVLAFGRMTTWLVESGKTGAYLPRGTADVDDVVIRVRRGWTLRGRVVDAAGEPVFGVRVAAEGVQVSDFTRRDGTFDLSPVFRDETTVRVRSEDYRAEVGVRRGEGTALRIEATPQGAVHGKVVDATGGPLAGVTVARADAPEGATATTSADGTFSLYGLPIGRVVLALTLDERTRRVPVQVRHRQPNPLGPLELP